MKEEEKEAWESQRQNTGSNAQSSFISVKDQMDKPVMQKKAPPKKVDFDAFASSDEEETSPQPKASPLKKIVPIQF